MQAEVVGRLARVEPLVARISLILKPGNDGCRHAINEVIKQGVKGVRRVGGVVISSRDRTRRGHAEIGVAQIGFCEQPGGLQALPVGVR
jgi:hypothetical protein